MIVVVVVTYNSAKDIEACLESVFGFVTSPKRVAVVDNGSADIALTAKVVEKFPGVRLIRNRGNLGFGVACNRAAKEVSGDYLLFLNPDAVLLDSLSAAVDYLKANPMAGVLGLRLVDDRGVDEKFSFGYRHTLLKLILRRLWPRLLYPRIRGSHPLPVDWVSGSAMLVRREAFDRVGGFDRRYFMYFEDQDLCLRIKKLGFQVVHLPTVRAYHRRGGGAGYSAGQETLFRLHYGLAAVLLLRLLRWPVGFFRSRRRLRRQPTR